MISGCLLWMFLNISTQWYLPSLNGFLKNVFPQGQKSIFYFFHSWFLALLLPFLFVTIFLYNTLTNLTVYIYTILTTLYLSGFNLNSSRFYGDMIKCHKTVCFTFIVFNELNGLFRLYHKIGIALFILS